MLHARSIIGYLKSLFLTKTESGSTVLLISYDAGSDDYVTALYTFSETNPLFIETMSGYVAEADNQSITINSFIDTLGTWEAYRVYNLNRNLGLEPVTDSVIIHNEYSLPLVTVQEFPVQLLESGVYIDSVLEIGTQLWPTTTDNSSYVMFRLEDGTEGTFNITRDNNYAIYIGGKAESECFEELPYAG